MTAAVVFSVAGTPAPQGSKKYLGKGVLVESSKRLAPWREDVRQAAMAAHSGPPILGPLSVTVVFALAKPRSAPKRRRVWPDKAPDVDKLARAVCDAITSAGVWRDDGQVVDLLARKCYVGDSGALDHPGCVVEIGTVTEVAEPAAPPGTLFDGAAA